MEAETVLNLYDSYWFDFNLFSKKPFNNNLTISEIPSSNSEFPTLPNIHTKAKSHVQKISSIFSPKKLSDYTASPSSVLSSQKLQTIFSGKVSEDPEDSRAEKETPEITASSSSLLSSKNGSPLKGSSVINRRRKKKGLSKSLSDLEFEELKGFIDLGFVFSEEDKDSKLAAILPGLQRLGHKIQNNDNTNNEEEKIITYVDKIKQGDKKSVKSEVSISRPYLSESWDILEKKKIENYLQNWRVPQPINQVQMKDNLRIWAHTVASTVR